MKFLHISDLHFGKSLHEISLAEDDQKELKNKLVEKAKELQVQAVVIAGDIYDRSNPSDKAVELFDKLVSELSESGIAVIAVAGNHDSGQKLGFASSVLEKGNVYIAGVPTREIKHITLNDEYGEITFWLMPYVYPQKVRLLLEREDIADFDDAVRYLIAEQNIDYSKRNVMVCHQNVTRNGEYAEKSGSESMVGGLGGIEYTAFENFDYTALGHIHKSQYIGKKNIRYAGSPLCYHFDEAVFGEKGAVLVEFKEKDSEPDIQPIVIEPLHKVRVIKEDTYDKTAESIKSGSNEYLSVEIGENISFDEKDKLRNIAQQNGSMILQIRIFSKFSYSGNKETVSENQTMQEMFADFYSRNGEEPDGESMKLIDSLVQGMERNDADTDKLADELIETAMKLTAQEVEK